MNNNRIKQSLEDIKARTNILDLLSLLPSELRPVSGGREWHGPCPRCGGDDRFRVVGAGRNGIGLFSCRQCHSDKWHDAIALVTFAGLEPDHKAAVNFLAARLGMEPVYTDTQHRTTIRYSDESSTADIDFDAIGKAAQHNNDAPAMDWTSEEWQGAAQSKVFMSHLAVFRGGDPTQHLAKRRFTAETIRAFRLGGGEHWIAGRGKPLGVPAVFIPWYSADGSMIEAIPCRLLGDCGQKYGRFGYPKTTDERVIGGELGRSTGAQTVFRCPGRGSETVIITEGEFNAISCWQESNHNCLSVGSQSLPQTTLDAITAEVKTRGYTRALVWTDELEPNRRLVDLLSGLGLKVIGAVTPVRDGIKLDASEMLQRGKLAAFLLKMLPELPASLPVMHLDGVEL